MHRLCAEAEAARLERGTSFAEIGRAIGLGPGQVARICRGQSPDLSIVRLSQVMTTLGLELSARSFPIGPAVRDAGQVRVLGRLTARVSPSLRWRDEVPVIEIAMAGSIDHRAWDAGIDGDGWRVRIDAETHLGDVQAVLRRVALKQRDSNVQAMILLLADTAHHRRLIGEFGEQLLEQFPVPQRRALAALRAGRAPGGNALILL